MKCFALSVWTFESLYTPLGFNNGRRLIKGGCTMLKFGWLWIRAANFKCKLQYRLILAESTESDDVLPLVITTN